MARFITKERALSDHKGGGVQYLPGHVEPFIDHVLEDFLSKGRFKSALDLGGGGLRFALPASKYLSRITVVDMDPDSMDVNRIIARMKEVGNDAEGFHKEVIEPVAGSILDYVEKDELDFDMVLLSRVIHFLPPDDLERLVKSLGKLPADSHVFVSAIVKTDKQTGRPNEFYRNTAPKVGDNFRRFADSDEAIDLRKSQNLPNCLHIFTKDYLQRLFGTQFSLVAEPIWATRTVQGFAFRKSSVLRPERGSALKEAIDRERRDKCH